MAGDDKKTYVVVGQGALVNCDGGMTVLVHRNAPLPPNANAEHIEHLLRVGLVAEVDEFVGGLEPTLTGDHQRVVTAPTAQAVGDLEDGSVVLDTDADAGSPDAPDDEADEVDAVPPKSASKADWVDHAVAVQVAQGTSEPDARALAEGLTKEQLIDEYGRA